jgi:NTP pyrophosphatase (non-canonical NTP hydrolase)
MSDITFKELIQKTNEVIRAFEKVEQRPWGIEGSMIELSKQVGELSKNVMMLEHYYLTDRDNNPNYSKASKDEIGNELSDILFMIIRIANHYHIDLERAHLKELDIAQESLKKIDDFSK